MLITCLMENREIPLIHIHQVPNLKKPALSSFEVRYWALELFGPF